MSTPRSGPDIGSFRDLVREHRGGPHAYVTLLGLRTFDSERLLERVEDGISVRALDRFRRNADLSAQEVADLVQITPRTLARRRAKGRLSPGESDRLLRASRLLGQALTLFEGDATAARTWLTAAAPALGGRSPLEAASTEVGAREVENLIGRLEHGVFS